MPGAVTFDKDLGFEAIRKGAEAGRYRGALVRRLCDDGIRTALASSSRPGPDILHAALGGRAGIDRFDVVVVGNAPHDAAAAAGLRTINVPCGGVPLCSVAGQSLRDAGCVAVHGGSSDLRASCGTRVSGDL